MSAPDFDAARAALARARAESAAAAAESTAAEHARRAAAPGEGEAAVEAARRKAAAARDAAASALGAFERFTDPRRNVSLLGDASPFALLPVRVETRFGTRTLGGAVRQQLWVRIYPDDCWIDTFEPTLSDTELANAQRYWRGIWRAGGVEADERAAWRGLVAAHGSGRAGWIADTYLPANQPARPAKAAPTDAILVISTQTPLAAAEAAAIATYWVAVWRADGDLAKLQAARAALEAAVGSARAGQLVVEYVPFNLDDAPVPPLGKSDVAASTAFVVFPPDPPTKAAPWSQAPKVTQFPERFVVIGYAGGQQVLEAVGGVVDVPLVVGPDPSVDPAHAIHPDGEELFVPDELAWLTDFKRAVEVGMGIEIDLTPEQARAGFDRLLVLGLQLGASDSDGKAALETLLEHHRASHSGLEIVPQGTPTHNTTGQGTGYSRRDDADESFDDRRDAPLFTATPDPMQRRDGEWLAEILGVDQALFQRVHGSDRRDQMQSRAMQRALWPATLGYWMDKMLAPVFDDEAVEQTRSFFTHYVSGRGVSPALRIGGQPYGVLPTTAFSRIRWLDPPGLSTVGSPFESERAFLARLFAILRTVDGDWAAMSEGAAHVGRPGDPHQTLLDIVALHPSSVEFHSRYAESLSELFNAINLWGFGPQFWEAILALGLEAAGLELLTRLGYSGPEPQLLRQVYRRNAGEIGTLIDDVPLSESARIRSYTDDHRNYVEWLRDAAHDGLDAVYAEHGFTGDATPKALLYLFLRHALMLGYYDAGYRLHRSAGFLSATELAAFKPEPVFVHVEETAVASESRFATLYKTEPRITASPSLLISEFIAANLALRPEVADLNDQIAALDILAEATTAQLERAFAEHIDVCSYRLDAWLLGLVDYQLGVMRGAHSDAGRGSRTGVYLGAYAWLEDLRPSTSRPTPVELAPELQPAFAAGEPLLHDPANGGYIHAPSLPHAQTAAVLRSGYLANAGGANPDTLAVNLSSDRVRLALSLLEGIRNGQSLGALLGYRFERGLHDDHGLAEVDQLIYPLRKAFPLVADQLTPTQTAADVPIEAIEARNVLDGRKLVTHIRTTGQKTYPFGLSGLHAADANQTAAVEKEVTSLLDVYDAVADVALAEGVHQAVQGNVERAGATLETYTTGNFPTDPEVVQTPAAGIGLTHRVAIHLEPGLTPPASFTPRARAEPAIDAWLAGALPPLGKIGCTVTWDDPVSGAPATPQEVTLADLGVRPIDVLELLKPDDVQAMTELDDRVLRFVYANAAPRPDATPHIHYLVAPPNALSIFEVAPLIRALKAIVTRSRPLRATDAMLQNSADPSVDADVSLDPARISGQQGDLDALSAALGTFLGTLEPLLAPVVDRVAVVAGVDAFLDDAIALLERAARFGIPQSGWGFAYDWRHAAFLDLFDAVRALVARWTHKLADFTAQLVAYDALPPATGEADRLRALRTAELLVSTMPDPVPATASALRLALDGKGAAFAARRDALTLAVQTAGSSFAPTVASLQALLPLTAFDAQPFDVTAFEDRAVTVAEDIATNLAAIRREVDRRRTVIADQLAAHAAATSAAAKVAALQTAAQALIGPEFQLVPEVGLTTAQADEWAAAYAASASLLNYATTTAGIEFPVDEWLYGAARVRPLLHAWETVLMLADAFELATRPKLTPIQLPHEAGASWLALQFATAPDSDRLLYTAQYPAPFDKTARQCGLLLDEWTEVIPATTRTTGIAFNFDRPDNEPPQSILLVTPASASGKWHWEDLVGALNETLDLAKKRAVEPSDIDNTVYSRFLPATIMAAALYGISITTTLAVSNGALALLEAGDG